LVEKGLLGEPEIDRIINGYMSIKLVKGSENE